MPWTINDSVRAKILADYNAGERISVISTRYRVGKTTPRDIARRADLLPRSAIAAKKRAAILADYIAGHKLEAIAAHYNVGRTTPREIARRAGIPPRAALGKRTHCLFGSHELTDENIYKRPDGTRNCRICKRQREIERKQRIKAKGRARYPRGSKGRSLSHNRLPPASAQIQYAK
jgi:Mor family transcriptional regulator